MFYGTDSILQNISYIHIVIKYYLNSKLKLLHVQF